MRFKATAVIGAVGLLAVALAAQDAARIEWKPTVGSKSKYKLDVNASIDMGGQKGDMVFGMIQTMEVKKVDGNKITVESKASDMTLMVGGQDMSQMMGDMSFVTTTVQDKSGEVLDVTTTAPSGEHQARMENSYAIIYPNKDLKVGESWTRKVKGDDKKGTVDAEGTYTFSAVETVDKWKTYKITYTYKELKGEAPMSTTGTIWLNADDCNLIKGEYKMKNVVFDPSMPPTDATAKIKKVD